MVNMKSAYLSLVDSYAERLESIESTASIMGFTSMDIFSLEPFFDKINNLSNTQMKTYKKQEDLPEGSGLFAFIILDKVLVQVREFFSDSVFNDYLFANDGLVQWRYDVHVNNDKVTPMSVQCLHKEADGAYISFEVYDGSYLTHHEYRYKEHEIEVVSTSYKDKKSLTLGTLHIKISEDNTHISKIEKVYSGRHFRIYDYAILTASLKELLKMCREYIILAVTRGLKDQDVIKEEILFILFEYNLQTPFPPSIAFAQTTEIAEMEKEGARKLELYNASDLFYYSEDDNPFIDLWGKGGAVFNLLNVRLLETYNYEELKQVCFDFYLDLCRIFIRKRSLKNLIPVSPDFHVTARDLETCNEWDFLQRLLPGKTVKIIEEELNILSSKLS